MSLLFAFSRSIFN